MSDFIGTIGGQVSNGGVVGPENGGSEISNPDIISNFTSSGTWTATAGYPNLEVVMVAGGGGPFGVDGSSGGGAGGMIITPATFTSPQSPSPITVGGNASDSSFPGVSLTAQAGGRGGGYGTTSTSGGSGGGGGRGQGSGSPGTQPSQPANSGTYGFGNAGSGRNPATYGGGGGAGENGGTDGQAHGGDGKTIPGGFPDSGTFLAGGGGGGGFGAPPGPGGQGGGGPRNTPGQANTGGGGGGTSPGQFSPGSGGSGRVIVREVAYTSTNPPASGIWSSNDVYYWIRQGLWY
tara:strand:- start:86 stop:958 length:873 start_codon:yes stop_codon:yes gene_type:complete